MATKGNLVPVGQVFEVFPGKHGGYLGIEVKENGFSPHKKLTFRNPKNSTDEISVGVSSIEIKQMRTNVAKPGDTCTIRVKRRPPREIKVGDFVFVSDAVSERAKQIEQQFRPRPQFSKPPKRERERKPYFA